MTSIPSNRGGHRAANSFRPLPATMSGRILTTAHSTSYLQTPTKAQLRQELAEAVRNTSEMEGRE
jgi:hypothetical protein